MNFTSFHFVAFFFVTLILGHLLKNRSQRIFLLLASYYFYGAFEPYYLSLILASSFLDYFGALGIQARRRLRGEAPPGEFSANYAADAAAAGDIALTRLDHWLAIIPARGYLWLSIAFNLGLLAYFKYTNFGIGVWNDIQPYGDTLLSWPTTNILLPIGISFYTFQSLSYTIDVYRGTLAPRRNAVDFLLYVAFFPQLVAGPIVRAPTFFRDLDKRPGITKNDIIVGMTRIVVGFFRKLVLADNVGVVVQILYGSPENRHWVDMWLAALAFGFQVYLDFAGYTDIARGVARLFGFEFDVNFNYPMACRNIAEHWQRWHISLTTWIRDYLYIPLGGNRVSAPRLYFNMLIIWVATGIWHGPAYHYIAWGVSQWVMIVVHRLYSQTRAALWLNEKGGRPYDIFARCLTMFCLCSGFIYFRAPDLDTAHMMIGRAFGLYNLADLPGAFFAYLFSSGAWEPVRVALSGPEGFTTTAPQFTSYWILVVLMFVYEYVFNYLRLEYFWEERNRWKLVGMLCAMVFMIVTLQPTVSPDFIYFQF